MKVYAVKQPIETDNWRYFNCYSSKWIRYNIFVQSKRILSQKGQRTSSWNWLLVSISSTFYEHIFCWYPITKKFQSRTFQLCNNWRQNIGKKCSCKMLMKLTPRVFFKYFLTKEISFCRYLRIRDNVLKLIYSYFIFLELPTRSRE